MYRASFVIKKHQIPFLPLISDTPERLPEVITELCIMLPNKRQLVYVEAEFFGGVGTQACAIFENGKTKLKPKVSGSAINEALSFIGVEKKAYYDEFEALGLNENRDTDEWVR